MPTNGAAGSWSTHLFRWEARTTELRVSQQRVRTFQVTGRVLDRYQADAWIGRGGELLRVLLPGDIELRDESLPAAR